MRPTLKAEFRKLVSVRATYVITVIAAVLAGGVSFAFGYSADAKTLQATNYLSQQITGAISAVSVIGALTVVLLLANEYRYNTILYTFTSSSSRSRVLLGKLLVASTYMVIFSFIIGTLAVASTWLGIQLKGHELAAQSIPYSEVIWRTVYYAWGFGALALALTAIIRNQVGAIMALFIIPTVIESFAGLALKSNVAYLPFSVLNSILFAAPGAENLGKYITVSVLTIVGLCVVAFVSFVKRDAN